MKSRLELLLAAGALFALTGCVTYPYASSFTACDNAAGSCYRACEDYEGSDDYARCHADCDYSANQCFAGAYEPYRYSYAYNYNYPWSGSYGSWYPDTGYVFSFGYYQDYRYGGRRRYDDRYDRYDRNHPRGGSNPPPRPGGQTGGQTGGPRPNPNDPSYARDQGPPRVDRPDEDRPSQSRQQSQQQARPQSQPQPQARPQPQPQPQSQPRSSEPRPDPQGGGATRSSSGRRASTPRRPNPPGEPSRDHD